MYFMSITCMIYNCDELSDPIMGPFQYHFIDMLEKYSYNPSSNDT
jgi:hypothetical protein